MTALSARPGLLIVIPVHEEEGWTKASPPVTIKDPTRLSPAALAEREDRANMLHKAHIEAVQERAKRENERSLEARKRAAHARRTHAEKIESELEKRLQTSVANREKTVAKRAAFLSRREALAKAL